MKISPSQSTENALPLKTETVKLLATVPSLPSLTVEPLPSQTVPSLASLTVEPLTSQTITPSPSKTVSVSSSKINFFHTCAELKKEIPDAKDGEHTIYNIGKKPLNTHCQFDDNGFAWTLVMSYMYKNNNIYKGKPLSTKSTRKVGYSDFRLSKGQMNQVKTRSTRWRFTCNFLTGISKRDYAETAFQNLDPLTYTGGPACKQFIFIDVRGKECKMCTAPINQNCDTMLHVSSYSSQCSFKASEGAVGSEDNFGNYNNRNKEFSCSSSLTSSTDLWFGMEY